MPTDTSVNSLVINKLTKAQYDAIQSPSETEFYLVEESIDTTPTSGSDNHVSSGGVYTALYEYELGNRYVKDLTTDVNILENATLSTRNGTNSIGVSGTKKGGTELVTSSNRFYYVQIYDGSILFDGIPVRVGQIGYMYDRVSGQLFGNSGTGNFVLGADKN